MKSLLKKSKMRTNLKSYYVAVFYFFSTSLLFAQPSTDATDGSLNVEDAPTAPIDGYFWVLMGIGLFFAFYKYKVIQSQKNS